MELTYSKMLDEVITNGYANKIADFLPSLVEDYDIQKSIHGDMYIHTIKYISTDMVKVFKNVISFDYNKWINRDMINISISLPVLINLNHREIYEMVYRTAKFKLNEDARIDEDKASRASNILACKCTRYIYNNRDIMTDIDVIVDISKQIKVLYPLLATGV